MKTDFDSYWKWALANSGKKVNTLADGGYLCFECQDDKMTIENSQGNRRSCSRDSAKKAVKLFLSGETVQGDDRYFAAPYRHWKSAFKDPDERDRVTRDLEVIRDKYKRWVLEEIEAQPFFLAVKKDNRHAWVDYESRENVGLPSQAGIYLVYHMDHPNPVYIGMAGNLSRRLTYHFSNNRSSDSNSTLKKNMRRDGYWSGESPLELSFRFKVVVVPFGRVELEKYLHELFSVNTARDD